MKMGGRNMSKEKSEDRTEMDWFTSWDQAIKDTFGNDSKERDIEEGTSGKSK